MQTKKRPSPLVDTLDESMEKPIRPIHPVPKRSKKSFPSERVKAPKSLQTGTDVLSLQWEIGKGTFSKCYLGISEYTSSVFAVKAQRLRGCSETTRVRVEREMRIHRAASSHSAITRFISTIEDQDNLYFQLELCSNGDLNSYIKQKGNFSPQQAWDLMKEINSGVAFLHSRHILHRDLKMANIFLTSDLQPKIGDFGLAYQLPLGEVRKFGRAGTPAYMAPELCYAPHICSRASDIWAFGVLWFAVVYGELPFSSPTTEGTTKLVGKGVFYFPESPAVPDDFKALIKTILCTKSGTRPTAHELAEILERNMFQKPSKRLAGVTESFFSPRLPQLKSLRRSSRGLRLPSLLSRKERPMTPENHQSLEAPPLAARPNLPPPSILAQSPSGGLRPLIAQYRI